MHTILVEEIHLLLDGTIDTRVACMQTDYQLSTVIKLFHQCKLIFQSHGSRATHSRPRLCIISKLDWHQTSCIKNQIGFFQ